MIFKIFSSNDSSLHEKIPSENNCVQNECQDHTCSYSCLHLRNPGLESRSTDQLPELRFFSVSPGKFRDWMHRQNRQTKITSSTFFWIQHLQIAYCYLIKKTLRNSNTYSQNQQHKHINVPISTSMVVYKQGADLWATILFQKLGSSTDFHPLINHNPQL